MDQASQSGGKAFRRKWHRVQTPYWPFTASPVSVSDADSGTGLDQAWWGGDFAHWNEDQFVGIPQVDTGSGADATGAVNVSLSSADVGSGTDGAGKVTASLASLDTGSGSEAQQVSSSVFGTDGGLFFKANNFEGGTNGSAISIDNSGGPQVTAFENIYVSSGTGTMTYDNGKSFSGSLAMRFNTTSGSCVESVYWTVSVPSSGHLYSRCYVNLDSLPPLRAPLVSFYGQTGVWGMNVSPSGNVVASVTAAAAGTGATVLSTGTWYRIETDFFVGDGSSAQTTVRLYDSGGSLLETVSSGANGTGSYTSALIQSFYFGNANGYVFAGNIDDVAVTDYGWIGPGSYGVTESGGIRAVLPDTGSGSESQGLAVTLPSSDTGSGAEVTVLAMSLTDSGSGSESQGTTASLSSADTGSGTDTGSLTATAAGSDTGSGANISILGIALVDSGSGTDAGTLATTAAGSDIGSGADTSILGITLVDSGSGSESQGTMASLFSVDTGAGTESLALGVTLIDSGSGTDAGIPVATSAGADTGSGADICILGITLADSGSGSESQGAAVSLPSADFGSGTESLTLGITLADSGSGSESQDLTVTLAGSDFGLGAESQSVQASLDSLDTGSGDEAVVIAITLADSGAGLDNHSLSATAAGSDTGSGAETWYTSGPKLAADTAVGAEGRVLIRTTSLDSGADDEFGTVNPQATLVTATQGGSTDQGLGLRVIVLRNVSLSQNGAFASATATDNVTITTTTPGSVVYGAISSGSSGLGSAEPGSGIIDNFQDGANNEWYGSFKTVSATVTPGSVLVGGTAGDVFSDVAALELLPAGTITEDASGPPFIGDGLHTHVSTAVFSPPVDSYLVALVGSDGAASGFGSTTMTVTDATSLAWTEVVSAASPTSCYAGVWLARVTTTTPAQADSGSGTEGSLTIAVASLDAGTGSETKNAVSQGDEDDGSGDDRGLVRAYAVATDSGLGGEDQAALVPVAAADSGLGGEDQSVLAYVPDDDFAAGDENQSVNVGFASKAGSDTGTGHEFQWWEPPGTFLIFGYDTGLCQEGDIEPAADYDQASGTEDALVREAALDRGSGADDGSVLIVHGVPSDSDLGSGADSWSTSRLLLQLDSATGTDDSGPRLLLGLEAASGADAQTPLEVFPFPPPWLFLPGGGMRLRPRVQVIWRPGTLEERVLREWPEFHPSQVKWAEEILRSTSIAFPVGSDGGTVTDGQWPTATVRQYAAAPGVSQSSEGPLVVCEATGVPG